QYVIVFFFFSSRRRHTRFSRDWSSDVCSSDLGPRGKGVRVRGLATVLGRTSVVVGGRASGQAERRSWMVGWLASRRARAVEAERSEERRVGKESRTKGSRERE